MTNSKANLQRTGSYVDEPTPDLLKNTPSNIRRLEDEIEQCKGRQKYLAQTTSSSDGGDVRWYFCKVPLADNELAASVPRTEILGKSDYFRFGMRDSLALESSFLQEEEELLSLWWKEYAECSVGPSGRNTSADAKLDVQSNSGMSESDSPTQSYEAEEERVGVPVKGGLYEVDLAKRQCFPVYWHGENRRVLRGHWFAQKASLDWVPLREDVAEQLEYAYSSKVWHRRTFQPSGLFAARVDLQGSTLGLHALFTGEDGTWEAWLNSDTSGLSNIISFRGNGIKLRRGYSPSGSSKPTQDDLRQKKEEEMDDYCSQVPVRHLVFMVHGIGQRLEKANLVDDVGNFRHITSSLAERQLTSYQRDTQRVLFIPCQWRRGLKLGGESAVEKITLDGVRGLRVMLSATAHDVLYYMSPIYCQEIINSVSNQLNRLYTKFLKRNPGYDGKVSVYGHSLGSVLSYDILCHQHQDGLSSPLPMECLYKEHDGNNECPTLISDATYCGSSVNSNVQKGISSENLEGMVPEEITNDPFCNSPTSELEASSNVCFEEVHVSSSNACFEEVHVSEQQITESKQCNEFSLQETVEQEATTDEVNVSVQQIAESRHSNDFPSNDNVLQQGTSGMLYEEGSFIDPLTVDCGVDGDLDKLQESKSEDIDDKEKLIKCMKEEVDSLRARIADLESRCSDDKKTGKTHQGDNEVYTNIPKRDIKYPKLEFEVDTFFAVGSPLGVFLSLRNIRIGIGKGQDYWQDERVSEEMPACQRMFNIFHPFDPVAYRVEPLVCKEYINKRPVIIPYHRGGRRLHIGLQEFTENLAARSQAVADNLYSLRVKVLTACQSRKNDNLDDDTENAPETEERSYGSIMMERLTGDKEGRIDHVLQDKTFEHQYVSAIGAHTNYWRDYDTALFILKHLYRDIPEEPNSPEDCGDSQGGSTGRFYQSEARDEDLPLTFSDRILVKEFSRKLRKANKKP